MNSRIPLIAGNWKMFKTSPEAVETASQLVELVANTVDVDVMIAPVFTALDPVNLTVGKSILGLDGFFVLTIKAHEICKFTKSLLRF